jgi:hypothetical protein
LVNIYIEVVSLGDPNKRMFDDGAGMHEYSLYIILDHVVSASDPKDWFIERVTM